jgi:hypothetical protein
MLSLVTKEIDSSQNKKKNNNFFATDDHGFTPIENTKDKAS